MPKTLARPLIRCPICGQQMKRITVTHLNKHDMTMEQFRSEYGDIVATEPSHMIDLRDAGATQALVDRVINLIVSDEQIDDMARTVINNLMRDQDPRLRIGLNTAAVMRLQTFPGLYSKLESIQKALLDERRLASMTNSELAKTYQIVEGSVEKILNYLKSLSTEKDRKTGGLFEQNNIVNIFNQDPTAPPTPDSPAGREKLRALMASLVHVAVVPNSEDSDVPAIDAARVIDSEPVVIDQEPTDGSQAEENAEAEATAEDGGGDPGIEPESGRLSGQES